MRRIFILSAICALVFQAPLFANPSIEVQLNELKQMVQQLHQTVQLQQKEIEVLKSAQQISIPGPGSSGPGVPVVRTSTVSAGRWNPDIGVIADTVLKLDTPKSDTDGADRLSVRELELVMGSYVDPYSRLDVNIGFSDFEEAHIQEAYLTRFGLPWETTARVGRFKPKVGKALLSHRDNLETVDFPLVIQRYFGTDGFNKTGVDLTKSIELPFDSAHEASVGVIEGGNGEDGTAFGDSRRRPTLYSHLRNFWDLSESTNFELGGSHMIGSKDEDAGFESNILGLDSTLIHFYGPDKRLKLQSELFYLNRDHSFDQNHLGAYTLLDARFHKQWATGFRFDYADLVRRDLIDPDDSDIGYTGYITFFQTEFARWRLQFSHIDSASGKNDNQVLVQGIFAIGEHKHKLQ